MKSEIEKLSLLFVNLTFMLGTDQPLNQLC